MITVSLDYILESLYDDAPRQERPPDSLVRVYGLQSIAGAGSADFQRLSSLQTAPSGITMVLNPTQNKVVIFGKHLVKHVFVADLPVRCHPRDQSNLV